MKALARLLLLLLLCLLPLFLGGGEVRAVAESEVETAGRQELNESIAELLASLNVEELQKYLDSLGAFEGVSVKDKLQSVLSGDFALDYQSVTQSILSLVWEEIEGLLPAFAVVLASALVCGVLNSAKIGVLHSSMSDVISFVGYLAVGSVVFSCLLSALNEGYNAVAQMQRQMELVYPLLLTLMAGSGGVASVAIYRPAVAFFSSVITQIFTSVVMPLAVVLIVLSFVGNLSDEIKTDRLAELFKGISKWLIGLTLGLFSIFLSIQGMTSAQYDGLSLRAAKYAISNSVPIVGGFLSGGVDVVLAGSALIKNALGSFSILLLFATVFRPLVTLVAFQLFLRLCAAATDPLGGKISAFLSKMAGDTGYFIAGLLCVAFLYFLTLLLLVCSSGVIV